MQHRQSLLFNFLCDIITIVMDEIAELFSGTHVTYQPNSISAEHPRFSLYKIKTTSASQEARRKQLLESQKSKRYDYANHARGLATCEWEKKDEDSEEIEEMDTIEHNIPLPRSHKNQLMLSEWLVDVPFDLKQQWLLVLCPVGKRCLVIASKGHTKVYTKSGYRLMTFPSFLPGGGRMAKDTPSGGYTILDCIYNEVEATFFILDVMCWNSHPCFDSETEFRFYWVQTKIAEIPKVKESSKSNPYKFMSLPSFKCESEDIRNALWSLLPFPVKLDGLLFYHKKTHYTPGSTPLVGWLKGYMVPEILNIDVPDSLQKEKPLNYTTMRNHVPEAFAIHAERVQENENRMHGED